MEKKNGKILIVDDNVQILNALQILLKPEFAAITLFRNPNQIPFHDFRPAILILCCWI